MGVPRLVLFFLIGSSLLAAVFLAAGCSSRPSAGNEGDDGAPPAGGGGDDEFPGEPVPVVEYVNLEADPAPPNPVTGAVTPPELNRIGFLRFRADTGDAPPRPVSAILLLLGGHTIGTNEFLHLGREMVRMSGGNVEVWAQERRSHFLEDNWGVNRAEDLRDPRIAQGYYFHDQEVDGRTFGGFLNPRGPETEMMSEWGLALEYADIHRILSLVPDGARQTAVFLGGHSRGVAFAEGYAAYLFPDGHRGKDDVAGLVLIDGGARGGGPQTAADYLQQIDDMRRGKMVRTFAIPFSAIAAPIYVELEIAAMAAADGLTDPDDPEMGPDGIWTGGATVLHALLDVASGRKVTVTNAALFGCLMDNQFALFDLLTGQVGYPTGGAIEHGPKRDRLAESGVVYSWLDGDQVDPPESGSIQLLFWGMFEGPSNVFDRYYAMRWDVELDTAGYGRFETEGTWRDAWFNERTSAVDVPVYALETSLLAGTGEFEAYRDLLAPLRGQDRPRTEAGYHHLLVPQWGHLDPCFARREMNPFYPDLLEWLLETSTGTVRVPRFAPAPPPRVGGG